ncbi:hypothetical protein D7Y13_00935 [Corallococcus praedator]|uniref:Uncharacterized protein n=1 Tax=Corallococcus praedator TaxID=2316724 RepID=A0ABX9QR38_9BACT|nr:hypothetical protein D7X75_05685 [Corallococcus sp. CA031C]RKI17308.1 hypothetical protein D7Y13_00935 [Corallococcus praedator]
MEGAGGANGERDIEAAGEQAASLGWGEALKFVACLQAGDLKSPAAGTLKYHFERRFAFLISSLPVV